MDPVPPAFIDRSFRRHSSAAGALFTAIFMALVTWLLLQGSNMSAGGSGPGSGGGTGGGHGAGAGNASGDGGSVGAHAGDDSGAELSEHSGDAGAEGDAPAADAEATPNTARPPLHVGFTAPEVVPQPPVPVVQPPRTAPVTPGGIPAGGGAGGGGGDGIPSFMGVEGRGKRVAYVIDKSGSMNGQRLANTRYELRRSIRALPRDGEFYVVFFDHGALPMPANALVRATDANKDRYTQWINQQQAGGGTDPGEAMELALALGPDTIFLMSDGQFPEAVAERIRAANTRHCSVCTIAFHDGAGEALLQRIARENEGSYRFVAAPGATAPAP